MLRGVIWHIFFGDLNQSENLSEIKPPFSRYSTANRKMGKYILVSKIHLVSLLQATVRPSQL